MFLVRHVVPVAFQSGCVTREFVHVFIARDTLDWFFGQQGVFFIFFIFRNHQNDFLDFRLQEEQGLLDFELVTLEVDQFVDLLNSVIISNDELFIVGSVNFGIEFRTNFLDVCVNICLQSF